jgi:hypothetical protein
MAEYDDAGRPPPLLTCREDSPKQRRDTHDLKEVLGDGRAGDAYGVGAFAQDVRDRHYAGQVLE